MWELLPLGMPRECATQDCGGAASWELEVDGIGSCYCNTCKEKIEKQQSDKFVGTVLGRLT